MLYSLYCTYVNHIMYVRLAVQFSPPFVYFDCFILACLLDPARLRSHDHHQLFCLLRTILYPNLKKSHTPSTNDKFFSNFTLPAVYIDTGSQ